MLLVVSMDEQVFSEHVAATLKRPGHHVAFVADRERIFCAYSPVDFVGPSSAVIKLIQKIFDQHRDHSFFILRNRIFTTAPLTAQCRGMVKIVAKRARGDIQPRLHEVKIPQQVVILEVAESLATLEVAESMPTLELLSPANQLPLSEIRALEQNSPLAWLRTLAALNPRGEILHDYDRDIACILLSQAGELLGYGLNCNAINKTLHAEVNMVQRYYRDTGGKIPVNARIYTTRKPCKMCAGMIFDSSTDPRSLHIHFAEEDKSSQQTVLDAVAHWNRLDSE